MSRIKFAETDSGAILPTRGNRGDAGLDLYVLEDTPIRPGQTVDVPHGVAVQLPPNTWGMITGRSSAFRKLRLDVRTGVIDEGYTGPLFSLTHNCADELVLVKAGSRISQLLVLPCYPNLAPEWADQLDETERGTRGFGSTGGM